MLPQNIHYHLNLLTCYIAGFLHKSIYTLQHITKDGSFCFVYIQSLQETNNKGYGYVSAPNHIADEVVKLNNIELRGHHLIIEEAAT